MRVWWSVASKVFNGRAVPAILLHALVFCVMSQGPAAAQSQQDGRSIYERRCSVCHGDRGAGAYWASDSLVPPPRDFTRTDPHVLNRESMIDAVAHGRKGTAMTAWRTRLSEGQIAAVVDYIRAEFMARQGQVATASPLQVPFAVGVKGDPAKGGVFFHANCAECHGHSGNGRGRRADMIVPKPLDFTKPETRRSFDRGKLFLSISRGVPGTTMPAWSKVLNSQQIADVAEYVYQAFMDGARVIDTDTEKNVAAATSGKHLFLRHCSYCHGYMGDARTTAAQVLDPKPRDLTAPPRLDVDKVSAAVRDGRSGTAMPSFSKVLSRAEIKAVAEYVIRSFAARTGEGGRYHTAENGWPDHDARYAPAIPFALGELAVDVPLLNLSPTQREGLDLFKGACVSCHFGKHERTIHLPDHEEKGPHDNPPEIVDMTPAEKEGGRLYQAACAQCHAADGSGQNWIGRFLDPSPTDLRAPRSLGLLSSDTFIERTLRAAEGTSMPSFEHVLSRTQVESIAAYLRRAVRAE